MNSNITQMLRVSSVSDAISPVISRISINTVPNDSAEYLYAARIAKFDEDRYSAINSTFPTENFADDTEAYYYFYLGNDWIYTFRNNKLSLIGKSADDLFEDVENNWIYIKYSGMTLGEMRSVSMDELNSLFLNPEYANTEFGIISVLRTKGNKTEDAKVEFKFNMNEKYLSTDGSFVAEILMNDGTTISFTSEDVGNDGIEGFLVWFANTQMGNGGEFYCLKTANGIRYINYRLIIGVNIYESTPLVIEEGEDETLVDFEDEMTDDYLIDSDIIDNDSIGDEITDDNLPGNDIIEPDDNLPEDEITEPGDGLLPDVQGEESI